MIARSRRLAPWWPGPARHRAAPAARTPARLGRLGARLGAAAALTLATACRAYAPVDAGAAPTGRPVRVRLTDAGSVELASRIGPRAESLEGKVAAQDDSTITLTATAVTRRGNDEERWPGERLTVKRSAVAGVDAVRTSSLRTAVLVGSTVALLAVVRAAMGGGEEIVRTSGAGGPTSK